MTKNDMALSQTWTIMASQPTPSGRLTSHKWQYARLQKNSSNHTVLRDLQEPFLFSLSENVIKVVVNMPQVTSLPQDCWWKSGTRALKLMDLEMIFGSPQRYWLALAETFEENQNVGPPKEFSVYFSVRREVPQCHSGR